MTGLPNLSKPLLRVAAAVMEDSGRYFLAKRPVSKAQGGLWEFPGGKLMDGEGPRAALARELSEEFGVVQVSVGELLGLRDHDYGAQIVRIEAYSVKGDPSALRCLEHDQVGWFSLQEIAALPLAPADEFLLPILLSSGHP